MEVHFFGQFAADGRMRRAHMLTRSVPVKAQHTADADADAGARVGSEPLVSTGGVGSSAHTPGWAP